MNIAVVEDLKEDVARLQVLLSNYIKRYDFIPKITFFSSAEAFLSVVTPEQFDLCFMDVFMDGMNGVAAAEQLRHIDPHCLVIFLTSSPDYMQEGFRLRAWRYLLKPVTMKQLCEALPECVEQIQLSRRRLSVVVDRKRIEIPFSKIYYIITANRSIELHGKEVCIQLSRRISFEELTAPLLADYRFLLIGKGQVANLSFVHSMEGSELLMENGDKLSVSRAKRAEVSTSLVRFQFGVSQVDEK